MSFRVAARGSVPLTLCNASNPIDVPIGTTVDPNLCMIMASNDYQADTRNYYLISDLFKEFLDGSNIRFTRNTTRSGEETAIDWEIHEYATAADVHQDIWLPDYGTNNNNEDFYTLPRTFDPGTSFFCWASLSQDNTSYSDAQYMHLDLVNGGTQIRCRSNNASASITNVEVQFKILRVPELSVQHVEGNGASGDWDATVNIPVSNHASARSFVCSNHARRELLSYNWQNVHAHGDRVDDDNIAAKFRNTDGTGLTEGCFQIITFPAAWGIQFHQSIVDLDPNANSPITRSEPIAVSPAAGNVADLGFFHDYGGRCLATQFGEGGTGGNQYWASWAFRYRALSASAAEGNRGAASNPVAFYCSWPHMYIERQDPTPPAGDPRCVSVV